MFTDFSIGILRETRDNADSRVALTPYGAKNLLATNRKLTIYVQPSAERCYTDEEYMDKGCIVSEDLSMCDILLGIKEVDWNVLLADKTYLFFSHTNKKQIRNQRLLQTVIDRKITLIDYEFLYGTAKNRIAAFGYWAGLSGAYNIMRAYGLKYDLFELSPLEELKNKAKLIGELSKVIGKSDKILITGNGLVTSGIEEVLQSSGIYKVDLDAFLNKTFKDPVYFIAEPHHYVKKINKEDYSFKDFKRYPAKYESDFMYLAAVATILFTGHYWNPHAPRLFKVSEAMSEQFRIKLIGDIACDIEGAVPLTSKLTTINDSFYDYNLLEKRIEAPFSGDNNITIMAVDNLAGALAKESSDYFSTQLVNHVLPYFWNGDYNKVLKKATIAKNGKIKKRFSHLRKFVQEKL